MGGVYPDPAAYPTVIAGQKTVTTSGTAVKLVTGVTAIHAVCIKALVANTGKIVVGPVGTLYASNNGYVLSPGEAISIPVSDLFKISIDAQTSGEGVSFIAS